MLNDLKSLNRTGRCAKSSVRACSIFLTLFMLSASLYSCSHLPLPARNIATQTEGKPFALSTGELTREVTDRMMRVQEFRELAEWGKINHLRVWAAGGTATALAVYVKQDIENERLKKVGQPPKYSETRFGYHYFDIYRSTQDADIVIDGTEADAQKLEAFLKEKFDYLQGSKTVWEVRLLNESRGLGASEKFPLLGFDFQNQNSDSFSTAMVELTEPPKDENRIRDLFDWKNQIASTSLRDLAEGRITFHRNPRHFETKFAKAGLNPEIQSVIRLLTKALQYEVDLGFEDEQAAREIIQAFDPRVALESKAENDIAKNGQKIYWHSPDVERAWNLLEKLGLRKKLIAFGAAHGKEDLAEWLDREPLRTKPLGTSGRTAQELGMTVVAHETNSYIAYENISRSAQGKPNVFISRAGAANEAALHGSGFYTRIGKEGARGTGLTIRFTVSPLAREGTDFFVVGDYVVFRNAAAIKVIDESLNVTALEYFQLLASGEFSDADKGLLQRLKIKTSGHRRHMNPTEDQAILSLVNAELQGPDPGRASVFFYEWFESSHAKNHPETLDQVARRLIWSHSSDFTLKLMTRPEVIALPQYKTWASMILQKQPQYSTNSFVTYVLTHPELFTGDPDYASWINTAFESAGNRRDLARNVFTKPSVQSLPEFGRWVDLLLDDVSNQQEVASLLRYPGVIKNPKYEGWMEKCLSLKPSATLRLALTFDSVAKLPHYPKWLARASADPEHLKDLILSRPIQNQENIAKFPNLSEGMALALKEQSHNTAGWIAESPQLRQHPDLEKWVNQAIKLNTTDLYLFANHSDRAMLGRWVEKVLSRGGVPLSVLKSLPESDPMLVSWMNRSIDLNPEFIKETILLSATKAPYRLRNHPSYSNWLHRVNSVKGEIRPACEQFVRMARSEN